MNYPPLPPTIRSGVVSTTSLVIPYPTQYPGNIPTGLPKAAGLETSKPRPPTSALDELSAPTQPYPPGTKVSDK